VQAPVEIRYAGVVVSRSDTVRPQGDGNKLFLAAAEPMPVGTRLELRSGDNVVAAQVTWVFESSDPAVSGMDVVLVGAAFAADVAPARPAAAEDPAADSFGVPEPIAPETSLSDGSVEASAEAEASAAFEASGPVESGGSDGRPSNGGRRKRRRRR
jgi:hypothetical protein